MTKITFILEFKTQNQEKLTLHHDNKHTQKTQLNNSI